MSLTESMRKDPSKYSSLIYHNTSSTADYSGQYYSTASYGQQQQYPSQDYIAMLLEEAEKLYNKLIKELVDESISDYAFNIIIIITSAIAIRRKERKSSKTNNSSYSELHAYRRTQIYSI